MICPVVTYAPTAATKPNIAAQPLKRSASGVMIKKRINIIISFLIMTPEAERFNGWAAMLGFVAAVGAYVTTGQIIPGWF